MLIVCQKAVEFVYVLQSLFTNKELSAAAFRAAPGRGATKKPPSNRHS